MKWFHFLLHLKCFSSSDMTRVWCLKKCPIPSSRGRKLCLKKRASKQPDQINHEFILIDSNFTVRKMQGSCLCVSINLSALTMPSKLSPMFLLKHRTCNIHVYLTAGEISRPVLVRPMSGCRFKHMILLKTLCSCCQRRIFYSLAICESGYTPDSSTVSRNMTFRLL